MSDTNRRRWTPIVLFAATAAIALLIYAQTVHPGVYWGDTAEFQRVAYTLDQPHPTGYPFYLLLGRLWITIWPFGSIAAKMNLLSAVFAALTVGLVSALIYRVTRRAVAAASGGLLLAVSYSFWSQAVIAEVYALHTLLVASLLTALLWNRPPRPSWLPLTAFLLGLGLVHHRMSLLLLPGMLAYALCGRLWRGLSLRWAAAVVAAFVLGLSPLMLTYLQQDWQTLRGFLNYVLHSGGGWFSFEKLPEYLISTIWPLLGQQMGALGLLLALVGLVYSYRRMEPRSWGTVLLLGISWLLSVLFLIVYRVGDIFAFFPHFQVLNALLIGFGLAEALLWLERLQFLAKRPWLAGALVGLSMALALIWIGQEGWKLNDLSQERYIEERSRAVLEPVQSNSVLITGWPSGQPLRYHQDVGGLRQDVEILIDDAPSAGKVGGLMESGHPVFFWGREWLDLIDQTAYQVVLAEHELDRSSLFRVAARESLPGGIPFRHPVQQPIATDLVLDSYQIRPWPLKADGIAELTLCWSGNTELLRDRTLEFSLDTEHEWLSHEFEAGDNLDANGCRTHYLILPPAPFGETAQATIRVHQRDSAEPEAKVTMEALAIVPGQSVSRERLMLTKTPSPRLLIGQAELLGASNHARTSPGISFPVDAYWHVSAQAEPGPSVQLELQDRAGTPVDRQACDLPAASRSDGKLVDGIYAARCWLNVPRRAEPGLYTIQMGGVGTSDLALTGTIEVEEPERIWKQPDMANSVRYEFAGGRILLEGFDLIESAQPVVLTLYWKSVKPVDKNWKVFVHVVDQAGEIVAQNDAFPGNELRWTDTWKPREYVVDQHTLALPERRDGSAYTILVGMYDPETGIRVPIRAGLEGDSPIDAVQLTEITR